MYCFIMFFQLYINIYVGIVGYNMLTVMANKIWKPLSIPVYCGFYMLRPLQDYALSFAVSNYCHMFYSLPTNKFFVTLLILYIQKILYIVE